ncbi:hypothetical protein Tco_0613344, partial [Tanacetum coccineum]
MEESLSKFMNESAKRHEEKSNLIKEIRASTDAAIRNQGASIKALEIQIGQMSKNNIGPPPEKEKENLGPLAMAIPEDHLAKFHKITDAKEMWNTIKSRFGGNDESNKMQKYILKQQVEGFTISNTDGIHKGYERFQSLLSQLEIHGAEDDENYALWLSKSLRIRHTGKGPNWLFDLDYLTDSMNYQHVSSKNQANIHAGQQEANHHAGTKDKIVTGDSENKDESAQDCLEVPFWHSYSSTNTSSSKSDIKRGSPREEEQVFLNHLARLQRQEKEANKEAEALTKNLEQDTENAVTQAEAAKTRVGTASANEGLSLSNTTNSQEDDYEIPP